MPTISRKLAALLAACSFALAAAGCASDDAVEKDLNNAAEDVQNGADKAGKEIDKAADDVEKGIDGDSDGDGK